ncbi:hypothetical protein HUK80_07350 [Flavobacterium sp. MAH-1]|uniref:DUF748 domain-containing protein n=1 Tax=Flavobacterium agri TaxID=2743471 RepID=A0A7Y9C6T4_9FLAO|nr:hypothetical protein [Flavobacterium agri]NUY80704.1 hypothetical protein [Flavobacterium agri]NYA70728.1 hypothetical protein [Flavobacterium agri]
MNKFAKKILVVFVGLLLLLAGFCLFLNYYWIDEELPKIINEKNKSPYFITYKNLDVSLFSSTIKASDIVLVPKAALKDSIRKAGIYATVESVEVRHFSIWSLFFSDRIKASSIIVNKPKVTLYKKNENAIDYSKSIRSDVVAPFEKVISVNEVELNHADVAILYPKNGKPMLRASNISAKLDGIAITDNLLKRKIPFAYKNYSFSCDSVFFKPNIYYHIRTGKIETKNDGFTLHKLEYLCDMDRKTFVKSVATERDMYNIKVDKLSLENLDWGFRQDDTLFVHSKTVRLDRVNANIFRDKRKTDDLKKKKLYNALLRNLDFDLRVDTLAVRNSILEYEEQVNDVAPGKLRWNPFNLTALHVYSGFEKTKLPDVRILIDARFMDVAPLKADWTLNVLDKTDGFHIKGSIKHFPVERITEFSKPYMNFTGKGILDEVYFDFHGNDNGSKGTFGINYDDLKFTVYKKNDRKKKNKFLTAVARIFVKKDSDEKVRKTEIEVERLKDKSFFNMFWKSIAEGLKKVLV